MKLTIHITPGGPGLITWRVTDERYDVFHACHETHVHASGVVRFLAQATQAEVDEAGQLARERAEAAVKDRFRRGYGKRLADRHLGSCDS